MSVRKMVVVPAHVLDEISRWKTEQIQKPRLPPNPQISATAELQKQMQSTLNRDDLSESEKAQTYGETLYRFQQAHKKALTKDVPETIKVGTMATDTVEPLQKINDRIVQSVPLQLRRKAQLLLDMLKDHPKMSWDEQGTLKYKGNTISGTNIIDLVNDVIRQRKQFEPTGWQTFSRGLKDINVPQDIIGNRQRWNWIRKYDTDISDDDDNEESFQTPSFSKTPTSMSKTRSLATPHRKKSKLTITPMGIKREPKLVSSKSKWEAY